MTDISTWDIMTALGTMGLALIALATLYSQFRANLRITFAPNEYRRPRIGDILPSQSHKTDIYVENIGNKTAKLISYRHRKLSPGPSEKNRISSDYKETREPFDLMPGDRVRLAVIVIPHSARLSTEYIIGVRYHTKGLRKFLEWRRGGIRETKLWFPAALDSNAVELESHNFSHLAGTRPLTKLIKDFEK